jgi:hypothetical protein
MFIESSNHINQVNAHPFIHGDGEMAVTEVVLHNSRVFPISCFSNMIAEHRGPMN